MEQNFGILIENWGVTSVNVILAKAFMPCKIITNYYFGYNCGMQLSQLKQIKLFAWISMF